MRSGFLKSQKARAIKKEDGLGRRAEKLPAGSCPAGQLLMYDTGHRCQPHPVSAASTGLWVQARHPDAGV